MVSGMVRITWYPNAAPTAARPMPVLPEVGSMMVPPGRRLPASSARRIMLAATRSLALPAGFIPSSFTRSRTGRSAGRCSRSVPAAGYVRSDPKCSGKCSWVRPPFQNESIIHLSRPVRNGKNHKSAEKLRHSPKEKRRRNRRLFDWLPDIPLGTTGLSSRSCRHRQWRALRWSW